MTCGLYPSPGTPSVASHFTRSARSLSSRKLTSTLASLMARGYPDLLRNCHALPAHDDPRSGLACSDQVLHGRTRFAANCAAAITNRVATRWCFSARRKAIRRPIELTHNWDQSDAYSVRPQFRPRRVRGRQRLRRLPALRRRRLSDLAARRATATWRSCARRISSRSSSCKKVQRSRRPSRGCR